jgi:hypothetical protein
MGINMYRSTDRDAPVLAGQLGSLIGVLTEVLDRGYPRSTVTITRSGTVATVSHTGHKFIDQQIVSISGAGQADYNGNFTITYIDANSYSYTVANSPATPATGTILAGGEKTVGTCTISRSAATVTVALTGHGFTAGQRAHVYGATQPEYNGKWIIASVPDADSFTYTLPSGVTPATPATGTITVRYGVHGCGWIESYSTTNKKAWQQGISGSLSRMYLRVVENNASYHNTGAHLGLVDSMTGIDTLTNPSSSWASRDTHMGTFKSATSDSTARKWVIAGDSRYFILLTQPNTSDSAATVLGWCLNYFGDIIDYKPNGIYPQASAVFTHGAGSGYSLANCASTLLDYGLYASYSSHSTEIELPRSADGYTDANGGPIRMMRSYTDAAAVARANHMIPLAQLFMESSISDLALGCIRGTTGATTYLVDTYPDPVSGGFNMVRPFLIHFATGIASGNAVIRGEVPGVWSPMHRRIAGWSNNDTFVGSGPLAGRTFEVFFLHGTYLPWMCLETSDTWRQ